jgi:hypothetical protein
MSRPASALGSRQTGDRGIVKEAVARACQLRSGFRQEKCIALQSGQAVRIQHTYGPTRQGSCVSRNDDADDECVWIGTDNFKKIADAAGFKKNRGTHVLTCLIRSAASRAGCAAALKKKARQRCRARLHIDVEFFQFPFSIVSTSE